MKNKRLSRFAYQTGFVLAAFIALHMEYLPSTSLVRVAHAAQAAEESWKQEFNDVCAKTTDSMSLSREELKALIGRCEKLKPTIEGLEESARKVYRKRLEMCRNLLVFVLESKK